MTAYVCREHPDEPVTWRGTGCQECAREPADRLMRHDTYLHDQTHERKKR